MIMLIGDWPNSLDCTDLKISVEPAVTQYCVASVTYIHMLFLLIFILFRHLNSIELGLSYMPVFFMRCKPEIVLFYFQKNLCLHNEQNREIDN